MTSFSLPDIAAFINLPASDFSTAPEQPAPPRMTPDEARRAETEALAGQDEALRQRVKELMGWDDGYRGAEEQKTVYPKKKKASCVLREREPAHGGKSLNYGDTAGGSFSHSSRRQKASVTITETDSPVNPPAPSRMRPWKARAACAWNRERTPAATVSVITSWPNIHPDQLKPVKQREAAAELQTDQDTPRLQNFP